MGASVRETHKIYRLELLLPVVKSNGGKMLSLFSIALHDRDSPTDVIPRPGRRELRHIPDPSAASPFGTRCLAFSRAYSCRPRLYLSYEITHYYTRYRALVKCFFPLNPKIRGFPSARGGTALFLPCGAPRRVIESARAAAGRAESGKRRPAHGRSDYRPAAAAAG